ncbi:MAG: DNA-binding response regulator [Deltaproteobacteria bacterium RIFOXYD12_FULL_56_24]|nr:MAG: DNA-binding response regulator [Deltaproteobacteria bacterium RIFOXYD12_FULL_56_24]
MSIRIALVDDHAMIREGLRAFLEKNTFLKVVGEAATGAECLAMLEAWRPEVVIMDISMPDLNGIETTREIARQWPLVKVVILSVHSTTEHVSQAFAAGAIGYVLKESIGRELLMAIRAAHGTRRYLSEKIEATGWRYVASGMAKSPLESLSRRERQVLQLVVEGHASVEIAARLDLSAKTVETYRSRLMQKLGVSDITALVKFAIQHGLTTLG